MIILSKKLTFWFLLFCIATSMEQTNATETLYKKKIIVKHFQNPLGWAEEYNVGTILSDKLKSVFGNMKVFHLLEFDPQTQTVSPAQFIIQGRILKFNFNANEKLGDNFLASKEVSIMLEVINGKTGTPLIKERFQPSSSKRIRKKFLFSARLY